MHLVVDVVKINNMKEHIRLEMRRNQFASAHYEMFEDCEFSQQMNEEILLLPHEYFVNAIN